MSRSNPFPGMDPWLELAWPDVHLRLTALALDALGTELPDDLMARGEQFVTVMAPGEEPKLFRPDALVVEPGETWKRGLPPVWTPGPGGRDFKVTEPVLFEVAEPLNRWIEIRTSGGELVTVIEILSPANKTSGREEYRTKINRYGACNINVVEIDLLRTSPRAAILEGTGYEEIHPLHGDHYLICASRAGFPSRREIYPCALRERLPVIRIPLRSTDPDVPLDIQMLVDECYTRGRHWLIDHQHPLNPPLKGENAVWAAERVKAAGLGT